MPFEKGHRKVGGRKKGTPNKNKLADVEWSYEDIELIKSKILELVEKGNPTILSKFLDKMAASLQSIEWTPDKVKQKTKIVIK